MESSRLDHASITTTLKHLRTPDALGLPGVGSRLDALLQGKLKANKNDAVEATSQTPRQ